MSEKCPNNNNSDNPLTSRRTDGVKNIPAVFNFHEVATRQEIRIFYFIVLPEVSRELAVLSYWLGTK